MCDDRELAAVKRWIGTFIPIRTKIVAKLIQYEPTLWKELTVPVVAKRVNIKGARRKGIIEHIDGDVFTIKVDGTNVRLKIKEDEFSLYFGGSALPMWPIMWSFSDVRDISWLEHENGVEKMSQWFFRIFKHVELGYFFGFNQVEEDFYTDYWIPLYDSRGLNWHEDE